MLTSRPAPGSRLVWPDQAYSSWLCSCSRDRSAARRILVPLSSSSAFRFGKGHSRPLDFPNASRHGKSNLSARLFLCCYITYINRTTLKCCGSLCDHRFIL